jgi:hypothetical protein
MRLVAGALSFLFPGSCQVIDKLFRRTAGQKSVAHLPFLRFFPYFFRGDADFRVAF